MKHWRLATGFLAFSLLFFFTNRGAYRGWFDGDDVDNISWSATMTAGEVAAALVNPLLGPHTFRAAGQVMYVILGHWQGLRFAPYIAWIHVVHLLTVLAVLWLLIKLGFPAVQAFAGSVFFGSNMVLFDIYWKPMYVFDLTCGLFCALSILAWLYDRWILSLVCFWIAFKCKELAIMLPFLLAYCEYWTGQRRWKRLIPCAAIAASLAAQAAFANVSRDNAYTLHFTPAALAATLRFYGPRLIILPVLLLLSHQRRALHGLAWVGILMLPLLFLPGRLFNAYLYVPMLGMAIMAAAIPPRLAIAALAIWLPWNFVQMRHERVPLIEGQHENQSYAEALIGHIRQNGVSDAYIYDRWPENLRWWGVTGLLRMFAPEAKVYAAGDPAAVSSVRDASVTTVRWYPEWKAARLLTHHRGEPDWPYVQMGPGAPDWQLGEGWYGFEWNYRWTSARATARLTKPGNAQAFELNALVGPKLFSANKEIRLEVLLNGKPAGQHTYVTHGWQSVSWPVHDVADGPVTVEFRVEPTYPGGPDGKEPLGIAVGGFGFK